MMSMGATSAALLVRWFASIGATLEVYVPDQHQRRLWPVEAAFDTLKSKGADLVITVDCGAMAHSAIEPCDLNWFRCCRHRPSYYARRSTHFVRPWSIQIDLAANLVQGNLAAAGVVFVTLAALNRKAQERGWFDKKPKPDVIQWLD